jgi:hypothetical protein
MLTLLSASSLIIAAATYAFCMLNKAMHQNARLQYARVYCHTHFRHSA